MTEPGENDDSLEKGITQPLLVASEDKQEDEDGDQDNDASEEAVEESRLAATSIGSAYRLLTPSIKVCIYCEIHLYLHNLGSSFINFILLLP